MSTVGGADRAARGRWMWVVVAVFAFLHWDFWLWDDRKLWFGFLPAGLGYHALYSLAAGGLWLLFIRVAWPDHVGEWANRPRDDGPDRVAPPPPVEELAGPRRPEGSR